MIWARAARFQGKKFRVRCVGSAVPRYYFNICSDEFEETDLVGEHCSDDLAALKEALRQASALVEQQLFFNRVVETWIEVEDEDHREVMRLPLRAAAY